MTIDSPSLADVLLRAMEDRLRELNTCEPGQIVEYDATKQVVTVRPMTKFGVLDDDGAYVLEERPDIYDVPVVFHRSNTGYITLPLDVGDTGIILYGMRDIGQWRYTGQRTSPGDHRVCSMAGAMFIPGLVPNAQKLANVSTTDVVIGTVGSQKVKLGSPSATSFVALATKVNALINVLVNTAPVAGDGGAAIQTAVKTFWQNAAPAGLGSTVAASKVQAE